MPLQITGSSAGSCNGTMSVDSNAFAAASPFAFGLPLVDLTTVEAQAWIRDPLRASQPVLSNAV